MMKEITEKNDERTQVRSMRGQSISVKRKLFVGLTKAQIAVEVVLTERAAGELVEVSSLRWTR